MRDEVNDHLGVGSRLKNGAIGFQLATKHSGIDQVSIVRHCQVAKREIDVQWLHILEAGPARRRVAIVADGHRPRQPRQCLLGKYIGHMALPLFDIKMLAVVGHDAGSFLASMLKRVEAEVSEIGRLLVAVYPEHGALIVEFVGRDNRQVLEHGSVT